MIDELIQVKTYKSIDDLPIWNFDILCKSKDYQYLLHDEFAELPEGFDAEDVWGRIYDEYLKVYGLGDEYKEWCKLMRKSSTAYGDAYLHGKRYRITHAEIFRQMADALINEIEVGDLSVTCASLSKFNGFRINPTEVSVREFNAYLEVAKRESKNG